MTCVIGKTPFTSTSTAAFALVSSFVVFPFLFALWLLY